MFNRMTMLKTLIPLCAMTLMAQAPAPPAPHGMPPAQAAPAPHGMLPAQTAPAPEPGPGDPIAHLGAKTITYGDFTAFLKVMYGPRAEMIAKNPTTRGQAMKQYLEVQVLAAKGRKENLDKTPQFQATLAAVRQQVYARVLLDEERPGSAGMKIKEKAENPSEAELKAYFDANSERYATAEKFTARHILVSLKGAPGAGDKGRTEDEAKARIATIQAELKAGKTFEEAAKEYSDDPGSKANGGLYQDIPFGRFAKEFEEAVRTQEIGKVGEPVKTSFGYHLILVEARSPRQPGDFEKLKDTLRKQLAPERKEKFTKEFLDQAKKDVGFREAAGAASPAPKVP